MQKSYITEHFLYYCNVKDSSILPELGEALESNFERISNDFNAMIKQKIKVFVYHDLTSYHNAIVMPDAPDWVVGNALRSRLNLVSPKATNIPHSYEGMLKIAVHELTHVIVWCINPRTYMIPAWLNEGLALYEAGQISEDDLHDLKSADKIPSLFDLKAESISFGEMNGYTYSRSIIGFILSKFGFEALVSLIKAPNDFESIMGMPESAFEDYWQKEITN